MTKGTKQQPEWLQALEEEKAGDNQPVTIEIVNKAGNPYLNADGTPCTIEVLGDYSDVVRAHDRQNTNRSIRRGFRPQKESLDELLDRAAERCALAVAGWNVTIKGKRVEHSRENAKALFRAAPWVQQQVHETMSERGDFFGKPSAT